MQNIIIFFDYQQHGKVTTHLHKRIKNLTFCTERGNNHIYNLLLIKIFHILLLFFFLISYHFTVKSNNEKNPC